MAGRGNCPNRTRHEAGHRKLTQLAPRVAHPHTRRAWEAQNLQSVGLLVARSALARQESRGAHYRTDYPTHNDAKVSETLVDQWRVCAFCLMLFFYATFLAG